MVGAYNQGIKYDPKKIQAVGIELKKQGTKYNNSISNIKNKVNTTKNYWSSDSATSFFEKFNNLENKSVEISKELAFLSDMLLEVSGIYEKSDVDTKAKTDSLPTEGVFLV